jgi:predicted DNA-binding transcriptional regulator AlpA
MEPHEPRADDLLVLRDIAKRLRISMRTIRRWKTEGLLPRPGFKLSGVERWYRSEIEMWIKVCGMSDSEGATRPPSAKRGQSRRNAATEENDA